MKFFVSLSLLIGVMGTLCLSGGAQAAALLPPLGLPPVSHPADNPPSRAKIELGRKLFMDRRLSHNNTFSCAMCHVPEQGFTSNELATAVGVEGRTVRRNSPTLLNVAYVRQLFHDGREFSLENQVWGPLLARNEMANPSLGYVVEKLRQLPDYRGLFEKAFGRLADVDAIGKALAAYQRTLVSGNSRFDRWKYGRDETALSPKERLGWTVFSGKGGCIACHRVGEKHALFSDEAFHNTGIGYARSMGLKTRYRVELGGGMTTEIGSQVLDDFEQPLPDVGRYEVTLDPAERWAYRTPGLRNVALTAPYMHDGSLRNLEEVVEFYDRGGIENPDLDPLLRPLGLSVEEKSALVALLKTLTGDNVEALVKDARRGASADHLPVRDPAAEFAARVRAH